MYLIWSNNIILFMRALTSRTRTNTQKWIFIEFSKVTRTKIYLINLPKFSSILSFNMDWWRSIGVTRLYRRVLYVIQFCNCYVFSTIVVYTSDVWHWHRIICVAFAYNHTSGGLAKGWLSCSRLFGKIIIIRCGSSLRIQKWCTLVLCTSYEASHVSAACWFRTVFFFLLFVRMTFKTKQTPI